MSYSPDYVCGGKRFKGYSLRTAVKKAEGRPIKRARWGKYFTEAELTQLPLGLVDALAKDWIILIQAGYRLGA